MESRIRNMSQEQSLKLIESKDISTEDKCWALRKVQNPEILKNLLKCTDNFSILKTIIGDSVLFSEENLLDFAFNHEYWRIRLAAISVFLFDSIFDGNCTEIFESSEYDGYIDRPDLADIALNDENWHNRLVATLLIDDESVLENVSLNDSQDYVRITAISGIDDQDMLVNIIKKNHRNDVLAVAGLRITDESKIIDLIKTKDNTSVVWALSRKLDEGQLMKMFNSVGLRAKRGIIKNIHNQLFLIDTVYKSDDGALSLYACQNILNQKTLHDIVTDEKLRCNIETFDRFISFPDDYIYYGEFLDNVIPLIFDDNLLADIVFNHPELNYEYSISSHVLNSSILEDIYLKFPLNFNDFNTMVQMTDTEKLFEMALNHPILETRIAATKRIFDKDKLERIIENEPAGEVKEYAVHNLNLDESVFNLEINNQLILMEVIKKIHDDSQLLEILNNFRHYNIKQVVCESMSDEELLKDIACNNNLRVASQAINNISTESVLAEVALNASIENVSVYAVTHIDDNDILEDIFENSSSYWCRINALSRIDDGEFLADVVSDSQDEYLKSLADSRLKQKI